MNHNVHRLIAIFKWAASHEYVPSSVYERLKTVPALRKGATAARESEPVRPIALEQVEAVKPYLSRQVWALVSLQLHKVAPGRPSANCLWRWCRRGVLSRGGERLPAPATREAGATRTRPGHRCRRSRR